MKHLKVLVLYLLTVVITNPYQGLNYNQINVYETKYCSDYCYNQNDEYYDYFEEEDVEEVEDDLRFEYGEEKPTPLKLDFWDKDK